VDRGVFVGSPLSRAVVVDVVELEHDGFATFLIVIGVADVSTRPPAPRMDLMRMPLSVPSIVQRRTSMLWTPAVVSEPMEMPWPCLMRLSSMRTLVPPT